MDIDHLVRLDHLGPALARATGDARWHNVSAELISGGKSNLTFTLRSEAGELILRRPPSGKLLPTAHDMGREARVQRALADTEVPTARIVLTDGGDLIGVPCYVMEKVPGHVIRGELPAGYADTPAEREEMAWVFADTLARLHAVDYEAVGLADYGRPHGYMERQVRRWTSQWEQAKTTEVPEISELGARLAKRIPTQQRTAIVHGDYRIDNVIYSPEHPGTINAVLDWEMATLGDPLADLGLLMLYWRGPHDDPLSLIPGVTHLPGFPHRDDMLARYAATSGLDLSDMNFYQAFAHYKFAVIAQDVSNRFKAGAMGEQDFADLDDEVRYLGARGLELI